MIPWLAAPLPLTPTSLLLSPTPPVPGSPLPSPQPHSLQHLSLQPAGVRVLPLRQLKRALCVHPRSQDGRHLSLWSSILEYKLWAPRIGVSPDPGGRCLNHPAEPHAYACPWFSSIHDGRSPITRQGGPASFCFRKHPFSVCSHISALLCSLSKPCGNCLLD